jgi:ABC-type multidrug transport system ATPase subunit
MLTSEKLPVVECKHLSRSFGEFQAVHDVSLQLPRKTIVGIAGSNGAGKTTLIKLLAGLLRPTAGEILAFGKAITDEPGLYLAAMGLLLDESFLYDDLSLHSNFEFHAKLHRRFDRATHEQTLHYLADLLKISDWLDEPARILSRGMRKKADIIRTLLHEPEIVLLDEPFTALDVNSVRVLLTIMREKRDKKSTSFLLTSHDIAIMKEICDEIVILKKGRVIKVLESKQFETVSIESFL